MTTSSTTSAVDEFERVVASEDIMYTKTQVISEQLVCRREDSNPREFFLARFKYLYNAEFYNLLSKGNYFTGKISRLPTIPRKPRNFSTSNNLQYTVAVHCYIVTAKISICYAAIISVYNSRYTVTLLRL